MKFEFKKGYGVDISVWSKTNKKLEQDLMELVKTDVPETEVTAYLEDMFQVLECIENGKCDEMLFLMYDAPNTMPADARVDFVYRPTYLAATIMMTAYCRYNNLRTDKTFTTILRKVLNACLGRGFLGAGYESTEGLLDTLHIFAEGDTMRFIENYSEVNEKFSKKLLEAITHLETEICTGKVKNAWTGEDMYSKRGNEILAIIQKSYAEETEYVWYACYGSNISKTRFMKYINNCSDTTPPVEDRPFFFPHSIYFAKHTEWWKGAKAFLDDTTEGNTYGRIYKVTREQYEQIKVQEGSDYTKKLELGMIESLPVYSFTDTQKNTDVKMPSEDYYNEILKGLKECYAGILDDKKIVEYLNSTVMSETEFMVVQEIKNNPHYLSIQAVVDRTGLTLEQVITAVQWLVNHQVIKQDTRSINAGHQITDADACFYTVKSKTGRNLVEAMVNACSAAELFSIQENEMVFVDGIAPEYEGGRRNVVASRVERSRKNRTIAISLHGCKCQVCGFDFEKFYGDLGKGYIEVHHVNPLAEQNGAHEVNPETDLVCLCANCHRMIHKNGGDVLSVEELRKRIQR